MKEVLILGLIIILFGCVSRDVISEIHQSLDCGDFDRAQKIFNKYQYRFHKTEYLYFSGMINYAFNDNDESIRSFQLLLDECSEQLPDSLTARVLLVQVDNFLKTFEQQKAINTSEILLNKYSAYCDSLEIFKIKNLIKNIRMDK